MTNYYISSGAVEYVWGTLYEKNGKDISGDTFVVGLSTARNVAPTIWGAPDVSTSGTTTTPDPDNPALVVPTSAQRVLKLLISSTLPASNVPVIGQEYFLWARVGDSPEVAPRLIAGPINAK